MNQKNYKRSIVTIEGEMYTLASYDDETLPKRRLALYGASGGRLPESDERRLLEAMTEKPLIAPRED